MKFIAAKDIDKDKWDAMIAASPLEAIFSYSWYLDAVCEEWHALIRGDYECGMALPAGSKFGMAFIYQPIFSRQLDVVGKDVTEADKLHFLEAIPGNFRFCQFGFQQMERYPATFKAEEVVHQMVGLAEEPEQRFSSNGKRNAKKADKAGCAVQNATDISWLIATFKAGKGADLDALGEQEYQNLEQLMQALLKRNKGELFEVVHPEFGVVAMGFFMKDKQRVTYLKGTATQEGKNCGAMHLLFREAMKKYTGTHQKLDFGGSKVPSVAKFYKNFGAEDAFYVFLTKDQLPGVVKWIRNLKKIR